MLQELQKVINSKKPKSLQFPGGEAILFDKYVAAGKEKGKFEGLTLRDIYIDHYLNESYNIEGKVSFTKSSTSGISNNNNWINSKYFGLISSRLYLGSDLESSNPYLEFKNRVKQDFT